MEDDIQFPQYQPPGTPIADHKQAGPLNKIIGKMMSSKLRNRLMGKVKGVQSDQNVHVKHKKVKFY